MSGQVGVIETDENLFVVRHPTNLRRVEAATAGTKTAAVAAVPESPELVRIGVTMYRRDCA